MSRGPSAKPFLAGALALATSLASESPSYAGESSLGAPDAAGLAPAEVACLGQTATGPCESADASEGVCLVGCCCHSADGPEGTPTCAPCLACSDTASSDPAFSSTACPDDDAAVPVLSDDAGIVSALDAGGGVSTPSPPPSDTTGTGCASGAASSPLPTLSALPFFIGAVGWVAIRRRRRARGRTSG